jgi:hypothetical protein
LAITKIVNHGHLMPSIEQLDNGMCANIAGAACDKNHGLVVSFLRKRNRHCEPFDRLRTGRSAAIHAPWLCTNPRPPKPAAGARTDDDFVGIDIYFYHITAALEE